MAASQEKYWSEPVDSLLGHGLSNMTLRAQAVGGRVEIASQPMKGTTVTARFPFKKAILST